MPHSAHSDNDDHPRPDLRRGGECDPEPHGARPTVANASGPAAECDRTDVPPNASAAPAGQAVEDLDVWVLDDQDRYSRLRLIGWWEQEKLAAARVLVVGAGALGNEVLKNLALLGVGDITVIDFDRIQPSNLARSVLFRAADAGKSKALVAATVASELNPDCRVRGIDGDVMTDLGLGFIRQMDVVIGCVDNREARLWINRMCWKVKTPWIDGGIQEINGVAKVFVPYEGPCYECGMTERDYELIQLRYSCPLLKQDDILQGKVPTAPTIASIIGGMQVQEALKLIHGLPTPAGTAHVFNGVANQFYSTKYPFREDCLSHELYEPIEFVGELTCGSTLGQLHQAIFRDAENALPATLVLDRDFLVSLECDQCGCHQPIQKPRMAVSAKQGLCAPCETPMRPVQIAQIELVADDPRRLMDVGIPDQDILQIRVGDGYRFVQLKPGP